MSQEYNKELNKIKKIFTYEKYQEMENLDALGWYDQILFRYLVLNPICDDMKKTQEDFQKIIENPIIHWPREDKVVENKQRRPINKKAIDFLSRKNLYDLYEKIKKYFSEELIYENYFSEKLPLEKKIALGLSEECRQIFDEPVDFIIRKHRENNSETFFPIMHGDLLHVVVNLSMSDAEILEEMKRFLRKIRNDSLSIKKGDLNKVMSSRFTPSVLNGWVTSRVLIYIDVLLYKWLNQVDFLTDEAIADVMASAGSNANIKDQLKYSALYMLSPVFLEKLRVHVVSAYHTS